MPPRSSRKGFVVRGLKPLQNRMARLQASSSDVFKLALREEAELVMFKSKKYFVPVDKGTLRSSGYVNNVSRKKQDLEVTLGFGGASAPYALEQHENLSYSHTVGENKYLEKPLMRNAKGMAARIGKKLGVNLLQ